MRWHTLRGQEGFDLHRTVRLKGSVVYLSKSVTGAHVIEIINKETDNINFGVGDNWKEAKDMIVFFGSSLEIKKEN